jgi:hypothetical protein
VVSVYDFLPLAKLCISGKRYTEVGMDTELADSIEAASQTMRRSNLRNLFTGFQGTDFFIFGVVTFALASLTS